ncbi:YggS family pyridoxal phosphate-dependent enzyme [Colwellia sp. 4_MG-2023]|uniref:YggS family pyridoxal phosphate-dependent enzyme n=1 Tax=unclassified Colwellia TaxID=196834 RepID=UPI001C08A0E4|nr:MULTISPECIES: YggS family pyridoxal phosphate-dependent enzyme [unclassified Colwellia]MBU2923176.1 YggS family pyridoxal phosphate-dependent enzyme [Colwellia sp. C2M11]MDO6488347.1 YggS family pyridoxal phosphate-dependent enzyme [Colwellia sp. 6_MG-2023]MDO6506656.1 YggS family pyridoxal phosphate-dependent enzyme [Colwellia sp. 5_MG-2023]MDO6555482.1 YggS family pyridoxal phosphate-dependent enzyme [Colwellia sp. 4_MG-2023]MDO6651395.1 YggS family pyridoxal phosphate-dependent enzyme [C
MNKINENIQKIKSKIDQAYHASSRVNFHHHADITSKQENLSYSDSRQNPITLLAVSKTKPIAAIEQAYLAGQRDFGENYLQEAVEKITKLSHLSNICWHFIGPIQSNKTKLIAQNFNWVHSVDRAKIALRLNEHLNDLNQQVPCKDNALNICLQVNISEEASKSGIMIDEVFSLAEVVNNCDKLTLRGLMAIPEKNAGETSYVKMQHLFNKLQAQYPTVDTLSMGMSNDLTLAITHGSTMVRIGTAIFGERS